MRASLGKSVEEEKYVHVTITFFFVNIRVLVSSKMKFASTFMYYDLFVVAGYIETRYTCCQGDLGAEGCQVAKVMKFLN